MPSIDELDELLRLLRDHGVVEYKTPELSLLLSLKPESCAQAGQKTDEAGDIFVPRTTPLPPLPRGSTYASLPSDMIPAFPGSSRGAPVPERRVATPKTAEHAPVIHEAAVDQAMNAFIASNTQE